MALRGDLASVDLAQVFQMLALNKKVGLLSIQSPRLWKVLYFDERGVSLYFNEHNLLDRAIATFVRVGRIHAAAIEEMRDHSSRNEMGLLDTLLAGGYLTEEELSAQMRYEVEEEIYELFFCRDARFEFLEGQKQIPEREGKIDGRFFFNTESVIMEAARRIDEWSYIAERIVNGLEVFTRTKSAPQAEDVGEECAIVYDCVDGRRNVARIVEASGLSSFAVFKNLSQLLDQGYIIQLAPDQLVKTGQVCIREGRPNDAINLFEKAIELGVGVPEVHSLAAAAYEGTSEFENAIYHLKCDAEYRIASGDIRGAAQRLHAAGALVPTDLASRERLVELALSHGEVRLPNFAPLEEGKILVDLFMAAGDLRRVRGLLERLLTQSPDDIELKKQLVSVHTKAGDQARVIELYESIAKTLVRQHRPLEAVAYLQKILMLDRTRSDISDQVRSLYAIDERSRSRRRAMATMGAVCLLLVLAAVGYSFYDQAAEAAFERIDVKALLEADDYDQAVAAYDQFLTEYPLTTVTRRAKEELARIDGLRLKYEAALLNRSAARERELQRLRAEYRNEWRHHRELFLAGKPEEALEAMQRARKLLAETGEQEDVAWALEEQVESNWQRLDEFVSKANELEKRCREELGAGRTLNAWVLAVELHNSFDITAACRRTRIPVLVTSRPQGARVLRDGEPIQVTDGGKQRAITTPAILMCGRDPEAYALHLDGFESTTFSLDPRARGSVEVPLRVIPRRTIRFVASVQSPVAASGDWVVAGLRNGRVGIASARTGEVRHHLELGGLRAVEGAPLISGDRCWFFTNELTLEAYRLDTGTRADGWPIPLASAPQTELVSRDGRLAFVDRDNRLHCLDQGSGRILWSQQLEGAPVGPPTIERRTVRAAVASGRVVIVDAVDGRVVDVLKSPVGFSGRVCADSDLLVLPCADGRLRAANDTTGKILWTVDMGRNVLDGELAVHKDAVYALGADARLQRLDRATGKVLSEVAVGPAQLSDLRVDGDRLLMTLRYPREGRTPAHDLLQARRADDLSLLWEFGDEGTFTGAPGIGVFVSIAGSNGDAVLLQ